MKQRITFIRNASDGMVDPATITPKDGTMTLPSLQAAKEHHLTLSLPELPQELVRVLEQSRELHLRWVSPTPYHAASPYNARLSPGLHVFWTPEQDARAYGPSRAPKLIKELTVPSEHLCSLLKRAFSHDVKCNDMDSFSSPPVLAPRFASSASHQSYAVVTSLATFMHYMSSAVCGRSPDPFACRVSIAALPAADQLTFDYDAISHAAIATAYWSSAPTPGGWRDAIHADPAGRVEVGVLQSEPLTETNEPTDLKLGGFLTVLGEHAKPSATLFSFPARHHALPAASVEASFDAPTGLHPTLRLALRGALAPPAPGCALHAYLALPSALFLDRYTLHDPLLLAAHNLSALPALSGATDLEAPDYAVPQWGSAALLALAPPPPAARAHTATVPLHARYLAPAAGGAADALAPAPAVFWACPADDAAKFASSPFDRAHVGYDGLFGARTAFHHVAPAPGRPLVAVVSVPVLDAGSAWAALVEPVTGAVVAAGFVWLVWCLVRPVATLAARPAATKRQ